MLLRMKALVLVVLTMWLGSPDDADASDTDMSIYQAIIAANYSGDGNVAQMESDALSRTEHWLARQIREIEIKNSRTVVYRPEYWPNATVPYAILTRFSGEELGMLRKAFEQFHKYSCLRFREHMIGDSDYLAIVDGLGCSSFKGRVGGMQQMSLRFICRTRLNYFLRYLSYTVGVGREHNRPDRDDHITINVSNIHPFGIQEFEKESSESYSGVPYDYLSITHYPEKAYSRNRFPTIVAKNTSYQHLMGQSSTFSFADVKRLNLMYQCTERSNCSQFIRCPGSGFVGQDCQCWCPQPDGSAPAVHCTECMDFEEMCPLLSEYGYCTNNKFKEYMKYTCPRSCGICSPMTPA